MPEIVLISPISSPDEVIPLLDAGADEFYCGIWTREVTPNRREMPWANLNGMAALARVAGSGRPVSLVLNAQCVSGPEVEWAVRVAHEASALGIHAFIVADLGLMRRLRKELPHASLHASSVAGAMNLAAVEEIVACGADRVILPRDLLLSEIAELAAGSPVPLEVFVLDWKCPNMDACCGFAHESWTGVMSSGCCLEWTVDGSRSGTDAIERTRRLIVGSEARSAAGCAACSLPDLLRAGIRHFKLVGRRLDPEARLRNLRFINALRPIVDSVDFAERAKDLRRRILGSGCVEGSCYYAG